MFALQSLQVLFSGAPEAAVVFKRHCLSVYSIEQALVSLLSNASPVFQVRKFSAAVVQSCRPLQLHTAGNLTSPASLQWWQAASASLMQAATLAEAHLVRPMTAGLSKKDRTNMLLLGSDPSCRSWRFLPSLLCCTSARRR